MITIDKINKVCESRKMKKMGISKNPSWVDSNHQEGLEFAVGIIKSFWIKDGSRVYDEPVSESMKKTIEFINADKEKPKEDKPMIEEHKDIIPYNAELPDFLTAELMKKWATLSTLDRLMMFQKTPENHISKVQVGKNALGEKEFASYVKGNYMFKEANACFLFDWYLNNVVITTGIKGVGVTGTLYAWFSDYNKYISRPATGYQELNAQVDSELAKKGAITDAIKKGLSLFGFNSDVYSGERE